MRGPRRLFAEHQILIMPHFFSMNRFMQNLSIVTMCQKALRRKTLAAQSTLDWTSLLLRERMHGPQRTHTHTQPPVVGSQ